VTIGDVEKQRSGSSGGSPQEQQRILRWTRKKRKQANRRAIQAKRNQAAIKEGGVSFLLVGRRMGGIAGVRSVGRRRLRDRTVA
jgi:hypothetical protein